MAYILAEEINMDFNVCPTFVNVLDRNQDKYLDDIVYANKNKFLGEDEVAKIVNNNQSLMVNNLYNVASRGESGDTYRLNELGKHIAGKDGKISIEEIKALDTNGDNKISQQEFDAKKTEMNTKKYGIDSVFDGESLLDQNGNKVLDNTVYANSNPLLGQNEVAELNKGTQGVIANNLYDKVSETRSGVTYKMNDLGKFIAGDDGQITADEIKALDTNKDGEVSQAEIDAKKAEMRETQQPQLPQFNNEFIQLLMMLFFALMTGNRGGGSYNTPFQNLIGLQYEPANIRSSYFSTY